MSPRRPGERDRLVYSSGSGSAREPARPDPPPGPTGDGVVRVRRETKGRRGKGVTVIEGLPLSGDALRVLAADLKRRCGSGGSVVDLCIEIQGEHRDRIQAELEARGYRVKRAGG